MALAEPHFEDESTIVSARRVEPLGRAKIRSGWRKMLALLPLLVAATLGGALGAVAVNYFDRRGNAPSATPQQSINDAQFEPALPAQIPLESPSNEKVAASSDSEAELSSLQSSQKPEDSSPSGSDVAKGIDSQTNSTKADQPDASPKKVTDAGSKSLMRPRRVHPPREQEPATRSEEPKPRGAGRIQDIFGGPNP
jgi:cytoskeletal protein RodZ